MKKPHAQELSRNKPILHFDVILQHNWPIEQRLLHNYKGFLWWEKEEAMVWSFHSLADETNINYRNHFQGHTKFTLKGIWEQGSLVKHVFLFFPYLCTVHWMKLIATLILVDKIYRLIALSYDDWEYVQHVILLYKARTCLNLSSYKGT